MHGHIKAPHLYSSAAVLLTLLLSAALFWLELAMQPTLSAEIKPRQVLADRAQSLTPIDALNFAQQHWVRDEPSSIDIDCKYFWWVGQVTNQNEAQEWAVVVTNSSIARMKMFVFAQQQELIELRAEVDLIDMANSNTPDLVIGHQLDLQVPRSETRTVVLRLDAPVAHNSLISLQPKALAERNNASLLQSAWLSAGAILALILYNLFIAARLHDSNYLLYVGHASGHLIYLLTGLTLLGAGMEVIPRIITLNMGGLGLGELCGALFVYRFLDLPRVAPRMALAFRLYIGWIVLGQLLFLLLNDIYTALRLLRASHILLAFLVIPAAVLAMRAGVTQARYILLGWSILIAFTVKGMLGVIGIIELHISAAVWAFAAVLFEMFVLSLALADRVRQLQEEKSAAEASSAAKGAFLATMSHEIRTPLNGILSMSELLLSSTMGRQQREYVDAIHRSGHSLMAILNDILDYSRVSSGHLRLELTEFSPRELVKQAGSLLHTTAQQKKILLDCQVDAEVPRRLLGDPVRLQQILLNLVGNAIKFTSEGKVEVLFDWVHNADAPPQLRIRVRDTGIGIPPERLPLLFDRFTQADASIGRRFGGTGLGLAICKELAQAMEGSIEVESKPGKGSCFSVLLPLPAVDGETTRQQEPSARPVVHQALRLLLVDDDAINRLAARELLRQAGHQVEAVDGGLAALEMLKQGGFDAMLLDVSMPDMDGRDVARRLRTEGNRLPIIGLTANALPEEDQSCIEAGMDSVQHKPINTHQLLQVLAELSPSRLR